MAGDRPREELAGIIARFGKGILSDPGRCEALLRDTCGSSDREIFLLASAHRKRIPQELVSLAPSTPKEILVRRLAERMGSELGFSGENALWAVISWALALQVLSPADARSLERKGGRKRRDGEAGAARGIPFPPASIIVSPSGDGHVRTLGEALAAAAAGTRIFVRPGVYQESLSLEKPVDIIGEGPVAGTVLEGAKGWAVQAKGDTLTIHGLTIRGGPAAGETGHALVEVLRGTALLEDCILAQGDTGISITGSRTRGVLRRLTLHTFRSAGILVSSRASAQIEGCRVASSRSGIAAGEGAGMEIRRCHVEGGHYGMEFGSRAKGVVEDSEVTRYAYAGILVRDGADPAIRRCTIHHGNFGVEVSDRGRGSFGDCDLSANARGFFITRGGNPSVARSAIHDGQFGVGVSEKGRGTFEECRITGNLYAGVSSRGGAHPRLLRCQVTGNRDVGVWVYEKAMATVEGCDLTGNARGPFTIEAGSKLTKKDTREG